MKKLLSGFLAITAQTILSAQTPYIEWQRSLGGTGFDAAQSIIQIDGGDFIVAGYSSSFDGDITGNYVDYDYWITRLNSSGKLIWEKILGGDGTDLAFEVQQTSDGGFIVTGSTTSNDHDVTGLHGIWDIWVVKLTANGNLQWQKSLGGSDWDESYSIQQTADGGFIVAGYSESNDGDVSENHGTVLQSGDSITTPDYWIVKLDTVGNIVWQKSLGGSQVEKAASVQQTTDGGFIVAGYSSSSDGDVSVNHGPRDCWIVKLDANGNLVWQKSLGGTGDDAAYSIQQTTDGGFIVAGFSDSNDGDVSDNHSCDINVCYDYWIVKLDAGGNLVWQKSLGGTNNDQALSIQQTTDGGFIAAGLSGSDNGDVTRTLGIDIWIVKMDFGGNVLWQKSLGGNLYDLANSISQTNDGGYIVAGYSSSNDNDVSGNHPGYNGTTYDYWVVKLTNELQSAFDTLPNNFISIFPNPVKNKLNISFAKPVSESIILVYDLHGKIRQTALISETTKIALNTEKLPDGFYTLQITNNKTGERMIRRFVKQE